MRRSAWERAWFLVFGLSGVFLVLGILTYASLPAHVQPTFIERMSASYRAPEVAQKAQAVAVFVFADWWVFFWSGVLTGLLEFGYKRRKRAGEMLRYYLQGEDIHAARSRGPREL